ncbi:hypothetical protein QVD17_08200 [Tagetes erecta]|uniref:Uncharacterized protein n=1 Tax=Tagetes erecta TaxID=13708 RepID=A0AAD8P4I5_TARER|nr:hypothetical protein QVD17_08200 [Tagetes erecta]
MSSSGSMGSHAAGKKSTIIWTDGLRQKFLEAVEKLGMESYFMQAMGNNHVEENNLSNDTTGMVQDVNSLTPSNFGFVPNPDDLVYDYGGCSSEVYPYNNVEAGLSSDVNMNNELATNWNQENGINIANPSTYSFVENSNGVGCNYSCPNEVGEMGSFYGSNSNDNMENDIALSEADMAWLLSVTANVPITENPPNQLKLS